MSIFAGDMSGDVLEPSNDIQLAIEGLELYRKELEKRLKDPFATAYLNGCIDGVNSAIEYLKEIKNGEIT